MLYCVTTSKRKLVTLSTLFLLFFLCFLYQKGIIEEDLALKKDIQQNRSEMYSKAPGNPYLLARLSNYLELRREMQYMYRFGANLTYSLNPNYYFFGSYPQEEQKPGEFEKFPFLFLPFFIIGIFSIKSKMFFALLASTVVFIAHFGTSNHLGEYPILPFVVVLIFYGIKNTILMAQRKQSSNRTI